MPHTKNALSVCVRACMRVCVCAMAVCAHVRVCPFSLQVQVEAKQRTKMHSDVMAH